MRIKRILAALLATLMALGSFTFVAFAEEATLTSAPAFKGEVFEEIPDYLTQPFNSVEAKLDTMQMMIANDRYQLYVEPWTGEVICYDTATGQTLSTNPYDVYKAGDKTTDAKKEELLSQFIIKYKDKTDQEKTYNSYKDAALLDQITVRSIKSGVRIEYSIGRAQSTYLVPYMITADRFEEMIAANLPTGQEWLESGTRGHRNGGLLNMDARNVINRYVLQDPTDPSNPEHVLAKMYTDYPITQQKGIAIYVLTSDIVTRELLKVESLIKEHCPEYSYEELEKDHNETGYTGNSVAPALFKMALEYKLTDNGMTVSLPANGLRYDETNYTLEELQVLPFVGAGDGTYTGYNFIPDGSGSIVRFEDFTGKNINLEGNIYGIDYAYLSINGSRAQAMRLPVFGVVENTVTKVEVQSEMERVLEDGTVVKIPVTTKEDKIVSKGFLAIIEEGDALASISSSSGEKTHKYYSVVTKFNPRPKDKYKLSGSISVGSNSEITVLSERKYVGKLTFNFIMLNDAGLAAEKGLNEYYDATWVGMANAYRDYLENKGILTRISEESTTKGMPLYVETFGAVTTTKKILSMPVEVDVALTSFENIKTMYDELAAEGITNVNFKLSGYANGDLAGSTVPSKLEWNKAVGGAKGFRDLVSYAKEKGFNVYPDFNFTTVLRMEAFDGFSLKKHAAKTIDDRYVYKVVYGGVTDTPTFEGILVSPSAYNIFYDEFAPKYLDYGIDTIALTSMSTDLNSDFDQDEPYNREDTKLLVTKFLDKVDSQFTSVLGKGGNAYSLKYFDHILEVALDSSRFARTSAAVPFVGFVLHGYKNYAGTPINMEGDIDLALLKAIESGASIYFILNYDNTQLLKDSQQLSKYYAVRYDITKPEVIEQYNKLNAAIGDLQTTLITDHQFLLGERVADADEIEADIAAAQKAADEAYEKQKALAYEAAVKEYRKKYENGEIPAGVEIVYEMPEKQVVTFTKGGVQKDADGKVLFNSKTGKAEYVTTNYTTDDESIVKVTYGDKVSFIINYNDFDVTVWDNDGTEYVISGYSFIRID